MAEFTQEMLDQALAVWAAWGVSIDQLNTWTMGTATGGPNDDGRYPMTNRGGTTVLVPCPAKVASLVPTGQPAGIMLPVFADQGVVRAGTRLAWVRSMWPLTITSARASLYSPDLSPSRTGGLQIDIKANGTSIFSGISRLKILPGQVTSLASGTAQPVIGVSAIPDDAEITVDVLAYGVQARGLRVALIGHYAP